VFQARVSDVIIIIGTAKKKYEEEKKLKVRIDK
jgi:hypothetical protein